jgi:hypothetical protein
MWLAIRAFAYHVQDSGFNPPVPSKKKNTKKQKKNEKRKCFPGTCRQRKVPMFLTFPQKVMHPYLLAYLLEIIPVDP